MNMTNANGYLQGADATNRKQKIWDIGMVLLGLYVLFNYIAQETLLPPAIHSLVMYAFIAWTAFGILVKGKVQLNGYTLWYLLVIAFSAISMLWAEKAVTGSLYAMFVALVLTFCVMNAVNSLDRLEACIMVFVIAADIMGIMLIATGQLTVEEGDRLGAEVTGNANSFSALLMVSSVFAAWFFVYKKGFQKYFCLASLIFQMFMMGLSGGRKTVIVVVVCLLWFILMHDTSKSRKVAGNVLKAAVILALLYWAVMKIPVLYTSIGARFEELFTMLSGGESAVSSDTVRDEMVRMGLQKWLECPIWGYGLDTFKYYNREMTGHFYYAHNNYVELLYDLGLLGIVLYYSFYIYLFQKLRKLPHAVREFKILGMGILFGLLIYDFGGISYYTVFIQIALCLVGIILRNTRMEQERA